MLLTTRFWGRAWLIGLDMCPEAVLIGNVANLPKHAMFVLVAVATFNLHWMVAFLLFPLFVTLVINYFVTILVWIEFVMLMIIMMLYK